MGPSVKKCSQNVKLSPTPQLSQVEPLVAPGLMPHRPSKNRKNTSIPSLLVPLEGVFQGSGHCLQFCIPK